MSSTPPWVSGPSELLQHGLRLLDEDSDLNRRLAFIAIDNAVELTIKTYLGLPRRVTGIRLSRSDFEKVADSFPKLLDALEQHAAERLDGIDLGEIEWCHRLRNQLYHQGCGITVEREKAEVYASMSRLLFKNLFGLELQTPGTREPERIGRFLSSWVNIDRALTTLAQKSPRRPGVVRFPLRPEEFPEALRKQGALEEFNELRELRNNVVHVGTVPGEDYVRLAERWAALWTKFAAAQASEEEA